jgi:5-methylcytosine-specific restriction enzyme subunit McrC
MGNNRVVLVENEWTNWRSVAIAMGQEPVVARRALLKAGRTIRRRLRLRSDPFVFRTIRGKLRVRVAGVAGTLSLPNVAMEILPKFAKQADGTDEWNVSSLFLLEALNGRHVLSLAAVQQRWQCHRVLDLIGHAFADCAERGLRDRPICTYRQIEETSVALRGRLNLTRQVRNWVRAPHLLECDVSQLDAENPFNDVLKWAATSLTDAVREPSLRARLRVLSERLPGRGDRSVGFRHSRTRPPPQYKIWADALELARLLARGLTHSTNGGNSTGYSVVFNMERAFERFVEHGLSRAMHASGALELTSERQQTVPYARPLSADTKTLYCRPDNIVKRDGVPLIVVDAKYKLLDAEWRRGEASTERTSPLSTDLYELLAGMLAHGCSSGVLVYPSTKQAMTHSSDVRTWTVDAYGAALTVAAVPIHLRSLNSREAVRESFAVVEEHIVTMAEACLASSARQ